MPSDAVQTALILAIPPTIAATAALVVAIKHQRASAEKLGIIAKLTDQNLKTAHKRIEKLEKLLFNKPKCAFVKPGVYRNSGRLTSRSRVNKTQSKP